MYFYPLRLLLRFEPDEDLKELRARLAYRQSIAATKMNALKRGLR